MKEKLKNRLSDVLECTVYTKAMPHGVKAPCCVVEEHACENTVQKEDGVELDVIYRVTAYGIPPEALLFALGRIPHKDGAVFHGLDLNAKGDREQCTAYVTYRVRASLHYPEEAPMMGSMSHKMGKEN